ncbi:MAG: prepilin-type N-terminal cleavage/methylation domain-containing protein [Deltaproteobacteria bacterium]|jgi:prepilin-type N-terminal cleavage/methylation domain-containing protein|nr:MAG: prepilin-type N-terminal cleavage/methylation domain-containing protein [Deltaproteobacteria bacterium]
MSERLNLRGNSGFTIIELIAVAAIIAVMAAIAIPNIISWIPVIRVNSAARDMVSEMQLVRMKAVSEKNDYVITFDTTTNQYSIYDDGDNDFSTAGVEASELVKTVDIDANYSGIQFGYVAGETGTSGTAISTSVTFSSLNVTFEPNGTANKNGSIYLIPTEDIANSRRDRQRAITVIQTGRIKLWKYDSGSSPSWK